MTTVAVVCENEAFGSTLAGVLERMPTTTVRAVLRPGPAVDALLDDPPDVLVVDEATVRWARTALALEPKPKVVVVTSSAGAAAVAAFVAGAEAVVPAHDAYQSLALVVATVANNLCVLPPDVVDVLLADRSDIIDVAGAERIARLTPREREVLTHLMRGRLQPQVATALHLSVHTVRFHVKQILTKLRVHSTLEAAMLAARSGMTLEADEEPAGAAEPQLVRTTALRR